MKDSSSLSNSAFVVDDKLPAGNIIVERIDGDSIRVRQDMRDTAGPWFYWAFRVAGAAGRTLKVEFSDKSTGGGPVGVRGPVVSIDGGATFSFPLDGTKDFATDRFTFAVPAGVDEVRFYNCHPYTRPDWDAFLARHADLEGKRWVRETLCTSRKGADVPCLRVGAISPDRKPEYRVMFTARHHCGETMASWAIEGEIEALLADERLCERLEMMVVPFVDYDGAQAGDQGKNRRPHDHNRDYTDFLYPETAGIRDWVARHANNRLDAFIDEHCPWIRGNYNEFVYSPLKRDEETPSRALENQFAATLERIQTCGLRYKASDDLPFGKEWNVGGDPKFGGLSSVRWAARTVRGLKICRTFEIAFANANGAVVTPEKVRVFGHDILATLVSVLDSATGKLP